VGENSSIIPADEIAYKLSDPKALGRREQKVDLQTITFELGSAQLTPQGQRQLDEVAQALNFPAFRDKPVLIAGHTDSRGSHTYNQGLSERRAASVRDYLIQQHGYDAARLTAEGDGEDQLLPNLPGTDANQRRVEFRLAPPSPTS
jgi:outer membrane protein OmpA-like peptidoglycan-associated protein